MKNTFKDLILKLLYIALVVVLVFFIVLGLFKQNKEEVFAVELPASITDVSISFREKLAENDVDVESVATTSGLGGYMGYGFSFSGGNEAVIFSGLFDYVRLSFSGSNRANIYLVFKWVGEGAEPEFVAGPASYGVPSGFTIFGYRFNANGSGIQDVVFPSGNNIGLEYISESIFDVSSAFYTIYHSYNKFADFKQLIFKFSDGNYTTSLSTDYEIDLILTNYNISGLVKLIAAERYNEGYNSGYSAGLLDAEASDLQDVFNNGYNAGYQAGLNAGGGGADVYNSGYNAGFTAGQLAGYQQGLAENQQEVYDNAYNEGLSAGLLEGYNSGYDAGYDVGLTNGYNAGLLEGQESNASTVSWLGSLLSGFTSILDIKILPGFTLGGLISIPLIFGLFFFLFKLIKGGG
jgi:hypothetical protein